MPLPIALGAQKYRSPNKTWCRSSTLAALGDTFVCKSYLALMVPSLMLCSFTSGFAQNTSGIAQKPTVSSDLLQTYSQTNTATTEEDYTKIARSCAAVIPDPKRSKTDREYAENLIAWALNRRGEVRGEAAAALVDAGKLSEADKLDRLAADDYETSLKYAPNKWRTAHNWAISLAMQGKYPQAIEQFTRVIELNDQYANAFFNQIGRAHV